MRFSWEDFSANAKNYWAELDESQRAARHWALAALALAVVLLPGWYFGRPLWRRWQAREALAQVAVFAQKNDYRNATLALKRSVELAPNDPATWQEAVRLLTEIGSPDVLLAREQLARLSPEDVGLKLALAGEALRFDRPELAEQTLAAIADAARRDEAFYRLAAALALALGKSGELEDNLARLAAAAPADARAQLSLASVRLWGNDAVKQQEARARLEALTGQSKVRVSAALELLKDATRQHDERRTAAVLALLLRRFAPELPADFPSGSLAAWTRLVERLKSAAAEDGPDEVAPLARWLADVGEPRETVVWLESLQESVVRSRSVQDVAAVLSGEIGDLDRLEKYLREGAWGEWPRDALTLAIASRLQRLRYNEAHARASWEDALAASAGSPAGLRALVRLAVAWREPEALEASLQAAAQRGGGAWALEALASIYSGRRDLPKLWAVYDAWVKQRPGDDHLAARWITLGCLLNRAGPELLARAESLQAEAGKSFTELVLARAAAQWRQGKAKEAAKTIDVLSREVREQPATLFWATLIYADLGKKEEVRRALPRALHSGLANEEVALLRAAAAKAKVPWPSGS